MIENILREFSPRFQGSTFEHIVETYAANFGPFDASPSTNGVGRNFLWEADAQGDGTLTLVTARYGAEWDGRVTPETQEWLSILVPRTGAINVALGGSTLEGMPGQMILVNNRQAERFFARGEPHLSDVLRLNWTVVAQTVATLTEVPLAGALDLSPMVDLCTASGRLVGNLVQTIASGMRNNGPLLHSPIAMSYLT